MERIPPEYQQAFTFAPGEQQLGCWYAVPIVPDQAGRLNTGMFGLETRRGLLLLTNYRLRLYAIEHVAGVLAITGGPAVRSEPVETIPLGTLVKVELEKHPALWEPLLVVRTVTGLLLSGAAGPSRSLLGWKDLTFVVDAREPAMQLFQRLLAAADLASAELAAEHPEVAEEVQREASVAGLPLDGAAAGPGEGAGEEVGRKATDRGPIHLHAEEDP